MKTIWGLFNTFRQADTAVAALQARGFGAGAIHALAPEAPTRQAAGGPTPSGLAGGLAGLLASSRARDIKGMGRVLATGTLGRALARAAAAHSAEPAHGLEEALMVAGLSPGFARLYVQGLHQGNTLLVVEAADTQEREVVNLLRKSDVQMLAGLPIAMPGEADFEQAMRREEQARAARTRGAPEKGTAEAQPGSAAPAAKRHPGPGTPAPAGDAHRTAQQKPRRPKRETASGPRRQSAPQPDRRSSGRKEPDAKK